MGLKLTVTTPKHEVPALAALKSIFRSFSHCSFRRSSEQTALSLSIIGLDGANGKPKVISSSRYRYNATVLAYGQTGSGKTYSMGTGFDLGSAPANVGIIPRAVRQLFEGIAKRQEEAREKGFTVPEFKISTQFMELYNEEIIDLFDNAGNSSAKGKKSGIRIHEDGNGNIYTVSKKISERIFLRRRLADV